MENITIFAKSAPVKATAKLVTKDFVDVASSSEPGKFYESKSFLVGDIPVAIRVYPNGFTNEQKGWVSIFIWNKGDAGIHDAKIQFTTDVSKTMEDKKCTLEEKKGWGFKQFICHDKTDVYKDKDFLVTASVEAPGGDLKILEEESSDASKKLCVCKSLYEKMEDTNFSLVFNSAEVPCHKQVLSAVSPVFEAMVKNQYKEGVESKANLELSEEVGRAFVKFIYTGELEEGILGEEAEAFLELGDMYDMKALKDLAEGKLLRKLNKKNMVELISIGESFRADRIFEAALKMTKGNMAWLRTQVSYIYKKVHMYQT